MSEKYLIRGGEKIVEFNEYSFRFFKPGNVLMVDYIDRAYNQRFIAQTVEDRLPCDINQNDSYVLWKSLSLRTQNENSNDYYNGLVRWSIFTDKTSSYVKLHFIGAAEQLSIKQKRHVLDLYKSVFEYPGDPNYCHDPEIIAYAEKIGIRNILVINTALMIGETTYGPDSVEAAYLYLDEYKEKHKPRKTPKTRTPPSQKRKILIRHKNT